MKGFLAKLPWIAFWGVSLGVIFSAGYVGGQVSVEKHCLRPGATYTFIGKDKKAYCVTIPVVK